MCAIRTLRVAGVQVESRNLDVQGNLRRAERLVAVAANRGADLVLCPEFLAPGYVYDRALWGVAEPCGGPTELWLGRMAKQYRLHIGASYLEANGDEFFNTFTLMSPGGSVSGRVRKESLPGFEGWFFSGCSRPKVIETELGRIGIGICWDNNTSRFMRRVIQDPVDFLLLPHSAPSIAMGAVMLVGERGRMMLRGLAGFYASTFGVPTVMVNKAAGADSWSPVPFVPLVRLRFHFLGQSTICSADGIVRDQLAEQEGVVCATVELNSERSRRTPHVPAGYWSQPPPLFPGTTAALVKFFEWIGKAAYKHSQSRRLAAREAQARGCTDTASVSKSFAATGSASSRTSPDGKAAAATEFSFEEMQSVK